MDDKLNRRQLLTGGLAGSLLTSGCGGNYDRATLTAIDNPTSGIFTHGVASGDPMPDRVILWTRLSLPTPPPGPVELTWQISTRENFAGGRTGRTLTDAGRDWTVKVDAAGLTPGENYFYRFGIKDIESGEITYSPIGRTKTLPTGSVRKARFAVVSCANWQWGYFNVYDKIAQDGWYDAVIHLGDYLYEQAANEYGSADGISIGRVHEPANELVSLADYRTRHRQYKTDSALQAVHAMCPMILLWDDHETANDSWKTGALNHQPGTEGNWADRKRAALRAYYEWMPVREPAMGRTRAEIYKSYDWGDLLSLLTLETRLTARVEQILPEKHASEFSNAEDAAAFKQHVIGAPDRPMIGEAQSAFVQGTMAQSKNSGQKWRLVANQILMANLDTPDMTPHLDEATISQLEKVWADVRPFVAMSKYRPPLYADCWQGYPWAREQFYKTVQDAGVNDMIVLTGDAHEFWANDLYTESGKKIGVEIGTSSVSAATMTEYLGDGAKDFAMLVTKENKEARFYDPVHRGFIDLQVTSSKITSDFVAISTVLEREYESFTLASFDIKRDKASVKFSKSRGLGFKEYMLYKGWA